MLVSLATVKTFLGLTDTSEDVQLSLWVAYADADIKDYLGWDVESASYPGAPPSTAAATRAITPAITPNSCACGKRP